MTGPVPMSLDSTFLTQTPAVASKKRARGGEQDETATDTRVKRARVRVQSDEERKEPAAQARMDTAEDAQPRTFNQLTAEQKTVFAYLVLVFGYLSATVQKTKQ
jgi:hypothetical protein